jgi:beta-glucanase (GH16 family)
MLGNGCEYGICGWGNNEHQTYVSSRENSYVEGGRLIIKAKAKGGQITSARLRTLNKFSIRPGYKGFKTIKISTRIKFSPGEGMWGAFWLLPDTGNSSCSGCGKYGPWASSGEIDVWESVNNMREVYTTIHYGAPWPDNRSWGNKARMNPSRWNVMTLMWTKDKIEWYLNGMKVHHVWSGQGSRDGWYSTGTRASNSVSAPFGENFHLLLNLATGGSLTGNLDKRTVLKTLRKPKTMHIDYIRIYGNKKKRYC